MRTALCCALLGLAAGAAGAQEREVTFEAPKPVTVTGFAVGSFAWDREQASNSALASKLAVSLFRPWSDNLYLFGQLTTHVAPGDSGATTTEIEIDNLIVSWTPPGAAALNVIFGRFDAPLGFERDDEPLNLTPFTSFNFELARPAKFTGAIVRYTASRHLAFAAAITNGWNVTEDNNRGKTGLLRAEWIATEGLTLGVAWVYGPEHDGTDAFQRSLLATDLTVQRGSVIVGAEFNLGGERDAMGGSLRWVGGAVTGFYRLTRSLGFSAKYDHLDDTHAVVSGVPQVLRSFTIGPMWFYSSAQEGIFSNVEHTTFHIPRIAVRAALHVHYSTEPFFANDQGGLERQDTHAVLEVFYVF